MAKKRPAEDQEKAPGRAAEEAAEQLSDDRSQRRPQAMPPDLAEAKRERDEYLELAQRTRADFDNYRKRVAKESADAVTRGRAELAREMLPVIDNLERALQAAGVAGNASRADARPDAPSEEVSAHEALARGVALVHDELRTKLERAGVEAYDPAGERFDPQLHEALSTRSEEGADAGVVIETVEKGYRLDGQVLRPARVVVSE
jgi:molecular chaperone GrpE